LGDTLWWSWTAPASGRCRLTNEPGSYCGFGIFIGDSTQDLVSVAPTNGFSAISSDFYADSGVTYNIGVSGLYSGALRLVYVSIPQNDNFADREQLTGSNVTITATVAESSSEPGEPFPGDSVWYEWTAPCTGPFSVQINSGRPTLAVYTGSSLTNLTLVQAKAGRNPDGNSHAPSAGVHFDATEGVSYIIRIVGSQQLALTISPRPINDDFEDRIDLTGVNVGSGSGVGATAELFESCDHSIWWRWTAPSNGNYTVSTAGSDPFYILRIRRESGYNGDLTATFWSSNGPSAAHFTATNGQGFAFMFCTTNNAVIRVSERHPPANDNFADRQPILTFPAVVSGTLIDSDGEPYEAGSSPRPHSVWYTWIPPSNGLYAVSTHGSSLPVQIDAYTGSQLPQLQSLNPFLRTYPSGAISASFWANQGIPVQIRVSQDFSAGEFQIQLQAATAADDGCSESIPLAGVAFSVTGTNSAHAGASFAPPATCFRWTTPIAGIFKVSVSGYNAVSVLKEENGYSTPIAHNDSLLWFEATQGSVYRFVVDAVDNGGGKFTLSVSREPPPSNDDFANRMLIPRTFWSWSDTTSGSSVEPGEPSPGPIEGGTLWWTWKAPSARRAHLSVISDDGLCPIIWVYRGSSLQNLQLVATHACDDAIENDLTFDAESGVEYQIAVAMQNASGNFDLSFEAPSNFEIVTTQENNSVQLRIEGPAGVSAVIEASNDLITWQPIGTNANIVGFFWFPDPDAKSFPHRFYRIR